MNHNAQIKNLYVRIRELTELARSENLLQHPRIQERLKELKVQLRHLTKLPVYEMPEAAFYDEDGEGGRIYSIKYFPADYTRQDVSDYLWDNEASYVTSPYDCSGQAFTACFYFARMSSTPSNDGQCPWLVCERWSVDV